MKNFMKYVMTIVLLAGSTVSQAGWYTGTINRIQTNDNGSFYLFVDGPANECGSNIVIIQDPARPGVDRIYASLLTYHTLQRRVQFNISSCDSSGWGVFSVIENL